MFHYLKFYSYKCTALTLSKNQPAPDDVNFKTDSVLTIEAVQDSKMHAEEIRPF